MWRLWDFKLLRWMQSFHQSTWQHETMCADRSSEDEQLLTRPQTKNTNLTCCRHLKLTFGFYEIPHKSLHFDNEVWHIVFESLFTLTERLHMALVRNFEVT
jgi:hypothetical protein